MMRKSDTGRYLLVLATGRVERAFNVLQDELKLHPQICDYAGEHSDALNPPLAGANACLFPQISAAVVSPAPSQVAPLNKAVHDHPDTFLCIEPERFVPGPPP